MSIRRARAAHAIANTRLTSNVYSSTTVGILRRRSTTASNLSTETPKGNFTRRLSDSWPEADLAVIPDNLRPIKGETLDLMLRQKIYCLQSRRGYRANVDSHVLALFAASLCRKQDENVLRVLDLGAGNGLVSILFARAMQPSVVQMVELQEQLATRARRNMALNDVKGEVIVHDLEGGALPKEFCGAFDVVLINPPFYPLGSRSPPKQRERLLARLYSSADIGDSLLAARKACDPRNERAFVAVIHDIKEMDRVQKAARKNELICN